MKKKFIYIISTPIGNLLDISGRAIYILKNVDLIVLENFNHSFKLLLFYNIKKSLFVINNFFEIKNSIFLLNKFKNNEICNVAIISSAGTPLVCDPGYFLINEALKMNIKIISIPGACALISALSVSGLPFNKFIFEGFLSSDINVKINEIKKFIFEEKTIVFYESSNRILNTLLCLFKVLGGNRVISVVKEITKLYESIITDKIKNVYKIMNNFINYEKGEFVIIVSSCNLINYNFISYEVKCFIYILLKFLAIKEIVFIVSKITKFKKNFIYNYILSCKLIKNNL